MTTDNGSRLAEADKAVSPVDAATLRRSHIEPRELTEGVYPSGGGSMDGYLWFMAGAADEFMPWGVNPKYRDRQLRSFWPSENIFASALYSVGSRNAGFSWDVDGPPRSAARVHDMLLNANMGEGWLDFIMKVSNDLYCQDAGAFIEIVRETDSPESSVIMLNHLDALRCWHTGIPEAPVLYESRKGGKHLLKWYEVVTLSDMPAPIETLYGYGYCALTRLLKAAQIARNISTYKDEKTGGKHTRAIIFVRGISTAQIQAGLRQNVVMSDQSGQMRFSMPPVLGTIDAANELQVETVDFVSLPDGYDEEKAFTYYIAQVALALGVDYQDLAPLPGGNLGTSTQSTILHLKSRGKGPAHFMKLLSHALNQRILPKNVEFVWREQDPEAEKTEAEIKGTRAKTRAERITSGEITVEIARQIAHDEGDLEDEYLQAMATADITENVTLEDDRPSEAQLASQDVTPPAPGAVPPPVPPPAPGAPAFGAREQTLIADLIEVVTEPLPSGEKNRVSDFLQTRIHKAFTMAADDLAALGYMDTPTRIDLSGVIGDALRYFSDIIGERIPHLAMEELAGDDARRIIDEYKALDDDTEAAIEQVAPDRLEFDEAFANRLAPALAAIRADAAKKLRARA